MQIVPLAGMRTTVTRRITDEKAYWTSNEAPEEPASDTHGKILSVWGAVVGSA
jgi:hypothetical protein